MNKIFLRHLDKVGISHIILISLVLHVFVIAQPQHLQIWDESIFLELTRNFVKLQDHTPYQLPGSYLFTGAAIQIFGDNWFSWRVPSVIFGMLTLIVFYKIMCHVTSEKNALVTSLIFSFDTIFFVHSTLYLRDVTLMFFGMFSFYLYLKKRYYLASLVLGFSFFIKETAIFFLAILVVYHVVTTKPWKNLRKITRTPFLFLLMMSGTFLTMLWVYDVSFNPVVYDPMIPTLKSVDGKDVPISYPRLRVMESRGYVYQQPVGTVTNPFEHLGIFLRSGYLTSEAYNVKNWNTVHTNYPWTWVLPLAPPEKGNNLGWVAEDPFNYTQEGTRHIGKTMGIKWNGDPNVPLWVAGFWGSMVFLLLGIRKTNSARLLVGSGIACMYVPYLLLSITGRVMFPYYFIYTVPFISLGAVLLFDLIENSSVRKLAKTGLLAVTVCWFVLHYPLQVIST